MNARASVVCIAAVSCLLAAPAFAGRPLTIDDAEPVAQGAFEFEAGLRWLNAQGERHRDLPLGLAYGLAPRLEISAGGGLHLRDRIAGNADRTVSGPQDSLLGFKWMPVKSDAGFMLAVAGSVKFATASRSKGLGSGDRDYDLTLIATRQWGAVALDVNLGRTWVGSRHDTSLADIVHYGAALRYSAAERLTWVGEVFADDPTGARSSAQANAGLQYTVRNNMVFDAALGRRLRSTGPDWVLSVGMTATF